MCGDEVGAELHHRVAQLEQPANVGCGCDRADHVAQRRAVDVRLAEKVHERALPAHEYPGDVAGVSKRSRQAQHLKLGAAGRVAAGDDEREPTPRALVNVRFHAGSFYGVLDATRKATTYSSTLARTRASAASS